MKDDFNNFKLLDEYIIAQEKMLYLNKGEAQKSFAALYENLKNYFLKISDNNENIAKGDNNYLKLKQANKLLRYIDDLSDNNNKLLKFSESEVIYLFEKQSKFKKILQKFLAGN